MNFVKKAKAAKNKKKKDKKSKQPSDSKEEAKDINLDNLLSENAADKNSVTIKCGKPVLHINFSTIKFLAFLAVLFTALDIIFCLYLLIVSVQLRIDLGYFVNLISKPDGDILPASQAIPTFLFLIIDIIVIYLLYKIFSPKTRPRINCFLFVLIIIGTLLLLLLFINFIFILAHIYSEHLSLHDGMMDGMKKYSTDSVMKSQIDRLQIELQCCGSKKYEEWYEIPWYDKDLVKGNNSSETSSTPFSCCSLASIFPCIHHDIEKTGVTYLYTPEYNLSISTNGCYEMIRDRKKSAGWGIIGHLFLLMLFQTLLLVVMRFLQTGHSETCKFEGHKRCYTIWLLGCYRRIGKPKEAPEPPPVPPELMD